MEISEADRICLEKMKQKIQERPRLLQRTAGDISCCIFRAPQTLMELNPKAYQPHIISVGPYYHGKAHLNMIEEHKWRFLGTLLSRNQGQRLEDYYKEIGSMEERARQCYSENMVLDGCFILEIFRAVTGLVIHEIDDPIFRMAWLFPFLMRDLIKLENQIPFFVLQRLFDLSKHAVDPPLSLLALNFFNNAVQRPDDVVQKFRDLSALHLLDLLRSSLIPDEDTALDTRANSMPKMIHCATKLHQNGITFKVGRSDSPLDVCFTKGVIEIPSITMDDFITSVFLNCIAFEQCHGSGITHVNTYAAFLGFLINTGHDVGLLRDSDIIENYYGTDKELANFFKGLGRDVALDIEACYLSNLFENINEYYRNSYRVQWASFKHTYFNTPWFFLSALAAIILLLLTAAQTFFSVFGYFRPPP